MTNKMGRFTSLLLKIGVLLLAFTLCRTLFFLVNFEHFKGISALEFIKISFFGLRFDLAAICMLNLLFITLYLLPFGFVSGKSYSLILKYLFVLVNSIAILFNCADMVYFRFINKRTTFDVFDLLLSNDFTQMLPKYLLDFWYVLLIWILFIWLLKKMYEWSDKKFSSEKAEPGFKIFLTRFVFFVIGIGCSVIGFRGGLQLIPIFIGSAAEYTSIQNIPLVLNTPFTVLKSAGQTSIKEVQYVDESEKERLIHVIHQPNSKSEFQKKNVVIIILESFSKEYVGFHNNGNGYTPFLDSLMKKSYVFNHAYANSKRSIEALPSILASIPTLMNDPYSTSKYGANAIESLASILKKEGYQTSFYHGGINGTMNFDDFCNIAGFDEYFGRDEYPNQNDYDGSWGIWDEPYFQYFANNLNKNTQPFFATIFSLSSHHPYAVPDKYKGKLKEGPLPIHVSISYTDLALRRFFETASRQTWFNNTLFVFTADHTSLSDDPYYRNPLGQQAIPIFFYEPGNENGTIDATEIQQIDIMPSVLSKLNYSKPFYSFGNNAFDTLAKHFSISYSDNSIYQYISDRFLLEFDGSKLLGIYDIKKDSLFSTNLISKIPVEIKMEEAFMKAFIQTYNHDLINNTMTVDANKK